MRRTLVTAWFLIVAATMSMPAHSEDDRSFIAGSYAVDPADCATVAAGAAFSKEWVDVLGAEVLTREGITSPREVHCRFRSASTGENGWSVKADCEELGVAEPYELAVTAGAEGSLAVVNEDVWGPEPMLFKLCPK
jgi:hypothetical protein